MCSEGQTILVPDTELTKFLFDAEHNTKGVLSIEWLVMQLVHRVDKLFTALFQPDYSSAHLLFPVFVCRCHGAFRGAVRLLFGGQTTETYVLLRLVIENALYAAYTGDAEMTELWLQRGNTQKRAQQFRKKFTVGEMRKVLEDIDWQLATAVDHLYEMSIDCGTHPNVEGHVSSSDFTDSGGSGDILAPGTLFWQITLQRLVRYGSVCLKVLSRVPQSRFDEDTRKRIDELYEITGAWKDSKPKVVQAEACGSG